MLTTSLAASYTKSKKKKVFLKQIKTNMWCHGKKQRQTMWQTVQAQTTLRWQHSLSVYVTVFFRVFFNLCKTNTKCPDGPLSALCEDDGCWWVCYSSWQSDPFQRPPSRKNVFLHCWFLPCKNPQQYISDYGDLPNTVTEENAQH